MAIEVKRGRFIAYNDSKKVVLLEVRQASRYLKNKETDKYLFQYIILDNNYKISNEGFNQLLKSNDLDLEAIPDNINFRINRDFPTPSLMKICEIYFDLSRGTEKNKQFFLEIYNNVQSVIETPLSLNQARQYNKGVCNSKELKELFITLNKLEKKINKKKSR